MNLEGTLLPTSFNWIEELTHDNKYYVVIKISIVCIITVTFERLFIMGTWQLQLGLCSETLYLAVCSH